MDMPSKNQFCRWTSALVLTLILMVPPGFGQHSFEAGVFVGFSVYQGDLTEDLIQFDNSRNAAGVYLRWMATNHIALRSGFQMLTLAASDLDSRSRADRGMSMDAVIHEGILMGEFYLERMNKRALNGSALSLFNPFLMVGLGVARVDANLFHEGDEAAAGLPSAGNAVRTLPVLPFGFGMKGKLGDRLSLGLEYCWRATFSDQIDNYDQPETTANDWYSGFGLNIAFSLGQKKPWQKKWY